MDELVRKWEGGMSTSEPDTPLTATLERLQALLRRKRRKDGRPENLLEMTAEQIPAEKKALQKALLQLQRRHGRPQTKQDKEIVRPLYERYRQLKQLVTSGALRKTDEEDAITPPEESSPTLSATAEPITAFPPSPHTEDTEISSPPHSSTGAKVSQHGTSAGLPADGAIKTGNLLKTSTSHDGAHVGPSRERRFRLTEEALEYFQHFSHVKVRRSFPLTSIEKIEYEPDSKEPGPRVFKLLFPTDIMMLQAETIEDAKDWVEKIREAWKMWQLHPDTQHTRKLSLVVRKSSLSLPPAELIEEEVEEEVGEGEEQMDPPTPPAATTSPKEEDRPEKGGKVEQQLIRQRSRTYTSDPRQNNPMNKFLKAARLVPILAKVHHHNHGSGPDETCKALHEDYAMIKYPQGKWAFPSEKLFKIDKNNLLILWRQNEASSHNYNKCLSLHRVLEIREGQRTARFERYPYDEVWSQSFSLLFEGHRLKKGKYVSLTSLDLICDTTDSFKKWSQGLKSLVSGYHVSSFPFQRDNTDPTILWLKQLWSCYSSDHEITEKTAIKIARRLKPTLTWNQARMIVREAHRHQIHHTVHHGNAIQWDGFVAIFNLLCQGSSGSEKLFRLFRKYAKKHPQLGMTPEELKEFLITECYWNPRRCTQHEIHQLIFHHDYHNRVFKKFVAQNKPSNFQIVSELLSYAGFLSFLRSKDNSAVNIKHDKVYQDMNQPLSHYFINSSHNTYLEEDQLYGRSSTDAYVRTLLQGCRCIEIDCWNAPLRVTGGGEPVIWHGFTLTDMLPFRDVIETIKDYAFNFSNYPVIVSIENHCSKAQQVIMAQIFEEVMGDVLASKNLVESQGRDRLPSPQELQGKILLKGSYGKLRGNYSPKRQHLASLQQTRKASASPTSLEGSGNFRFPRNRFNSLSSDSDVDGELSVTSVTSLTLRFDSREVHDMDRKQVREWAKLAEQGDKLVDDDQELIFATVPELQCLIPYCRAVSIKPWDWQKQMQTTVSEMFSFGENSANKHCENSTREMLACSERQLVRTYPKGNRFDSSNYDPIPMWNCGMQLVALNWQYPDIFMHLNQGLFRLNGGCGYVLKPEVMRRPDPAGDHTPYLPTMTKPHPDVPPVDLEIELLSGQRLCFWKKKCSTLTVEIHTYGIPHDTGKMEPPATAQDNNTFWPQWQERLHVYRKKILMPELCLVYFRVDVVLKGSGLGAKAQLYGQNCISLVSLMPGIKFIPLRTPGGELIPESGLFVQIKKKKLSSLTRQYSTAEDHPHADRSETIDWGDSTEQFFGNVDVTASIHPSFLREESAHNATPLQYVRRTSCPVNLECHSQTYTAKEQASWKSQLDKLVRESRTSQGGEKQLEVVAEVHGSSEAQGSPEDVEGVRTDSVTEFHLDFSTMDTESDII